MKILRVIGSLDPKNGGPVAAAIFQSQEMIRQGHQVEFVSSDLEGESFLCTVPGVIHALGPIKGKYGYNPKLVSWLIENAPKFDVVIVHGLWQYHSYATWLASKKTGFKYFIYTHGMLDPWFKINYPLKHLKKMLYWSIAEYRVLRDSKGVLFTCEGEKLLARKTFSVYKANEIVVNYGVPTPIDNPEESINLFLAKYPHLREKHVLLFLGRIHPKKGCDLLIEALAKVKDLDPKLHLLFAGPDQIGWKSELMKIADRENISDRITWAGMIQGDLKSGAYRIADVFILPSHSENFGVSVSEALSYGIPVLLSNKVNIWHEVQECGAGLVEPDSLEGITTLLQKWVVLSKTQKEMMKNNAQDCFSTHYEISRVVSNLIITLNKNLSST